LAVTLKDLGQLDAAVTSCRRALEIKPDYAEAYNNLGLTQVELGQLDEAVANCRQALKIKPDFAEAHANLGISLLEMGQLSKGWQEYEYRWEGCRPKRSRPASSLPQWTGQSVSPGDRLLVFVEQGMGDMLQFARYLPLVTERFPEGVSILVGSPVLELFRRSFPMIDVLDTLPADQSAWQWHCPLLSLPLAFGTTLETIPHQVPYLTPDPVRVAYWQSRIAALGFPASTRKIGVVWKSGTVMKIAQLKSITLQALAPLLNQPGCVWFSLQKEPDPAKAPWVASGKLIDWADEFGDFNETASLAMNLDMIISVDTSVAHLAGGLGLPTWLFNRHASDWRWMRNREDSPWYPTMRIFTQKNAGDWDEVVSRMSAVLAGELSPA
jgi:tetratricopeptide (TPR) repeat protein